MLDLIKAMFWGGVALFALGLTMVPSPPASAVVASVERSEPREEGLAKPGRIVLKPGYLYNPETGESIKVADGPPKIEPVYIPEPIEE